MIIENCLIADVADVKEHCEVVLSIRSKTKEKLKSDAVVADTSQVKP